MLPRWALEMVLARWKPGTAIDSPVFPDSKGGFRDSHKVQRAMRDARRPIGGQRRTELGQTLKAHRRRAGFTQTEIVAKLGWRKTRISLIETGRVRLEPEEAVALADAYRLGKRDRATLLEMTELAGLRSLADEMAWVTAHVFRKTTATILEGLWSDATDDRRSAGPLQDLDHGRRIRRSASSKPGRQPASWTRR